MPGGAGIPREVCKTGEAPRPRGGQDAIRGKLLGGVLCFPRKFRATGTDHSTPPRNASPALGAQPEAAPLPPRSARHAGGGTNPFLLFFIGKIPLRPAPGTIRNPIRAGEILRIIAAQTSRATPAGTTVPRFARVLPKQFLWNIPRAPGTEFLSPSFACPLPGEPFLFSFTKTVSTSLEKVVPAEQNKKIITDKK